MYDLWANSLDDISSGSWIDADTIHGSSDPTTAFYNMPGGNGEARVGWIVLDGQGQYDQNTGYFIDSAGMVFSDFQACVDYYAEEYQDQRVDAAASLFPGMLAAIIGAEADSEAPSARDYLNAGETCAR